MLPVIGGPEDEVLKINICTSSGTRHSHSQNDRSRTYTAFNLFTGIGTRHCHSRNKINAVQTQSPVLYGCRNALLPFIKACTNRFYQELATGEIFPDFIPWDTTRNIACINSSPQARKFWVFILWDTSESNDFEGLEGVRNTLKHLKRLFLARRRRIFFGSQIELIRKPPLFVPDLKQGGAFLIIIVLIL